LSLSSKTAARVAIALLAGIVGNACKSTDAASDVSDAGVDGAGDADVAIAPRDLVDGEPCSGSVQCRGGCCQLGRGNATTCAQIAPFDTTQRCACVEDGECAAIKLCGQPGFCQEKNDVAQQRFCSTLCR
jgi:hypothetical protein